MTSTGPVPSGIRGLSEQRRTPRIGKIRLGVREPNKRPCRAHDKTQLDPSCDRCTHPAMSRYFRFDDDAAGRQLREMFGSECIEIPVAFPSDELADFARRNLELWGAGTLKCRGNGELAQALVDVAVWESHQAANATGETITPPVELWASTSRAGNEARRDGAEPERRMIPCLGLGYDGAPACPKLAGGDCAPTMHVQVIVRGYPGLGTFQIDTGSVVNLQRLDDFVEYLGRFTGDRFAMVPLLLRLEPYEIRGRTYYGLSWDIDLPALEAAGVGSVAHAAAMTIPERTIAYLPPATRASIAAPAPAAEVEDEPALDIVIEEHQVEEAPDDAPEPKEPAPSEDRPPSDWLAAREELLPVLGQVLNGKFGLRDRTQRFEGQAREDAKQVVMAAFWLWAQDVPLLAPCEGEDGSLAINVTTIDTSGLVTVKQELERYLGGEDIRARPFVESPEGAPVAAAQELGI